MRGRSKKRKARTAAQERWVQQVASMGCIVCGAPAQVHHVIGETAKHNKVAIGQEFILPLCPHHHAWVDQGDDGLEKMKTKLSIRMYYTSP